MRIITCREIAYIWQTSCWNDRTLDQLMCKIAACAVSKRLMHMQNNTWIRKSNRIHQPEAQDSKTCPTSPDMLGASRWPLNWYGLPLQIRYFNFLCFNWEAGPHSAMGPEPTWRHWHSELATQAGWDDCWNPADGETWRPGPRPGPGRGPEQFTSLASSVSTALTEWIRPPYKSRAVSELRRRQPAHMPHQLEGLSQCWDGLSWDANPGPSWGCHGRRRARGRSGTGAVDTPSSAR